MNAKEIREIRLRKELLEKWFQEFPPIPDDRCREFGLEFQGKPLPVSPLPVPVSYEYIRRMGEFYRRIVSFIDRLSRVGLSQLAKQFPVFIPILESLPPLARKIIQQAPPSPFGWRRIDALYPTGMSVELNANPTEGWGIYEALRKLYSFYGFSIPSVMPFIINEVVQALITTFGRNWKPRVGIIWWGEDDPIPKMEVPILAEALMGAGFSVVTGHPHQVEWYREKIYLKEREVFLLLRTNAVGNHRWAEREREGLLGDFPTVIMKGLVIPPASFVVTGFKVWYAILWSLLESNSPLPRSTAQAIRSVIPPTYLLTPEILEKTGEGCGVKKYVVKKIVGSSGTDVLLDYRGVDLTEWMNVSIIQQFIEVPLTPWCGRRAVEWRLSDVNFHIFGWGSQIAVPGTAICRGKNSHPINVAQGGAVALPIPWPPEW